MSVYSLNSDDKFITPSGQNVEVRLYKGDTNDFKVTQTAYWSDHWSDTAYRVGPKAETYKALKVFGTTIEGDRFQELVNDLKAIEKGGIYVFVNRLGLCIISEIKHPSIKAMRINDYFGWSKYGVKVPLDVIRSSTIWNNKFDMHNGETVIDVQRIGRSDADEAIEELRRSLEKQDLELTACKKELEEKSMELEACKKVMELEKSAELEACRKELEEKSMELTACRKELAACNKEVEEKSMEMELTACRKELEWSKKNELLWRKLVEEKEKVNEMMQKMSDSCFQG